MRVSMQKSESNLKEQVEKLQAYCKQLLLEIEKLKEELNKWRGY